MKKTLLITITFFLTLTSICQETKLIEKKVNGRISERYYVLKSVEKIKHGEYKSYYLITESEQRKIKSGQLSEENFVKERGNYKNGKKDGPWSERYCQSIIESKKTKNIYNGGLKIEGNYKDDKKVGIWYSYSSEAVESFDYDNNIKLPVKLSPVIPTYPDSAATNGIQGIVKVKYNLHSDCSITNITIIQSLSPDCDKAVIETVKKMSELYKKYHYNCEEKVDTTHYNFKLFDENPNK